MYYYLSVSPKFHIEGLIAGSFYRQKIWGYDVRLAPRLAFPLCLSICCATSFAWADDTTIELSPDWTKVVGTTRTQIAIQDCPEPPLYRGQATHDKVYQALRDFKAHYSRLQPWYPYPKTAVVELKPPDKSGTYWDFTTMDELVEDFMKAADGQPVVFQPGTVPSWMTSSGPIEFPDDPKTIDWDYGRDGTIRDSTIQQFAAYQARLAGWYIKGGFNDEKGKWHSSKYHYKFDYWEPLNEEDQRFTPSDLTRMYDAAVEAVRQVDPSMKFMGPTIADSAGNSKYIIYFLNPKNHRAGVPVDMIAYHFYTQTEMDETPQVIQYTLFRNADTLLSAVGYIESIRKEFMPQVPTDINELGSILQPATYQHTLKPIPASWWIMSGAVWAYMYGHLAVQGIDVLTVAELMDYPAMFAGTNIVDWDTGVPNARYWVAKLLNDNFGPGDQIIQSPPSPGDAARAKKLDYGFELYAQAFITPRGKRKILLVNKRDHALDIAIAGASGGVEQDADADTIKMEPAHRISTDTVHLSASAVAVVTLPP